MPTDEELMLEVGRDDLQAFEKIVLRHQRSAWNAAYRFLADAEEAEDVVQDAFLKIFDAAPHYRPSASFRTYLFRIVTRLCMDRARKCRPIYTDEPLDPPDPSPSASEKLLVEEAGLMVRTSLDMLPQKQRMAIILKYYEGLGYREIASILESTEKAVERLLARARASLESSLSEWLRK